MTRPDPTAGVGAAAAAAAAAAAGSGVFSGLRTMAQGPNLNKTCNMIPLPVAAAAAVQFNASDCHGAYRDRALLRLIFGPLLRLNFGLRPPGWRPGT